MDTWGRFVDMHRLAAADGYIDARQPEVNLGIPAQSLYRHLRKLDYEPCLPGMWVPRNAVLPFVVRCRIVLSYLDEDAILTGASGLHAHGVIAQEPAVISAVLPADRWVRPRKGLRIHYVGQRSSIRAQSWHRLRLAPAARCLRDSSADASFTALVTAMVDALRLRRCALKQLAEQAPAGLTFPGSRHYRRAVAELSGELNHSRYERLGRRLLRADGLAVSGRPQPVLAGGHPVAEIDIPFFDICYGVEIDGPPHLLPEQAARDRARDRVLARDHGWTIDRFLWHELEDYPRRFVREVARAVEQRRAEARPIQRESQI